MKLSIFALAVLSLSIAAMPHSAISAEQSTCVLDSSRAGPEHVTPNCRMLVSDTTSTLAPGRLWGQLQCAQPSRYRTVGHGGDGHRTATGERQDNRAYRRLTVLDGDDFYGERCELGENNADGPTAFYRQGDHLVTYFSERLPRNYPLASNDWQTVMQMKQAQPSDGGGGAPVLEMQARDHKWVVVANWNELWSFPAQQGKWTRFAWDVYYSQDPSTGWLQVFADLNGDGDFDDSGERSRVLRVATLKTEIDGPRGISDGLAPGDPIPSHLRLGIYHDPVISCPPPRGCSIDVDNVQVVGP